MVASDHHHRGDERDAEQLHARVRQAYQDSRDEQRSSPDHGEDPGSSETTSGLVVSDRELGGAEADGKRDGVDDETRAGAELRAQVQECDEGEGAHAESHDKHRAFGQRDQELTVLLLLVGASRQALCFLTKITRADAATRGGSSELRQREKQGGVGIGGNREPANQDHDGHR